MAPPRIFHPGKTNGFILLRTLIVCSALLLVLSAALILFASVLNNSKKINDAARSLIGERNAASRGELDEK
jgi:hypothetical protein